MSAVHFSDQDFEEKVIKSKLPVLVDFFAEWCVDPNTLVATGSRTTRLASQMNKNDSILSFEDKLFDDRVIYSETTRDGGHCKKVITKGGRQLKVTDDHLFWSDKGWTKAEDLKIGDRVAVVPLVEQPVLIKRSGEKKLVVVDEKTIVKNALSKMRVKQYVDELKEKGLLPLKDNAFELMIIARLTGALFTDGTLYFKDSNNFRETSFCLGSKGDAELVKKDLEGLGFKSRVGYRENKQEIGGRKFTACTYRVKSTSTALWLLFKSLGVPVGNKTNQVYSIPGWIQKSSLVIKREFLAGFLGGDGPKLLMSVSKRKKRSDYDSLTINDLELYKREDLVEGGFNFAKQLSKLLAEFGVEITKIFHEPSGYVRKDGTKTRSIHLRFKQDYTTGLSLGNRVGYAYCKQKELAAIYVGEFLSRVMFERNQWKKLYKKVVGYYKRGRLSPVMIARKFDLSEGTVWGWLRLGQVPTVRKHGMKFKSWLAEMTSGLGEGVVWDVINSLGEVYLPAVQKITVRNKHSFVANGFVVHNCGPCKMAAPVIEELAGEYKDKVIIGKVDVDQNQETAGKFGVMSIPTVIMFKDGKEVDRKAGFAGKAGYEEMLKKQL